MSSARPRGLDIYKCVTHVRDRNFLTDINTNQFVAAANSELSMCRVFYEDDVII